MASIKFETEDGMKMINAMDFFYDTDRAAWVVDLGEGS